MKHIKHDTVAVILVLLTAILGWGLSDTFAETIIWPQQPMKFWHDSSALWETSPDNFSSPPGKEDFAYILSSNEVVINTPVVIRRLYIDRAYEGYPAAASTVRVLPYGHLTIESICQFGVEANGGALNIDGGKVLALGTDRAGTWSVRLDSGAAAAINISAGMMFIGGTSQVLSLSGSSTAINVFGSGSLELNPGATLAMSAGNSKIRLSEGGMIIYHGINATTAVSALAATGKLEGFSPTAPSPYIPMGTSNGVGWYYDEENTYVFADPQVNTQETTFVVCDPQAVEDITLRQSDLTYREDSYWTDWNFGKSQTLDVGYTTGIWNQYRAVTLLRFDMLGIPCQTVTSAKLRIYKPKNVTQITPEIPVYIYPIKQANKDWKEGSKECIFEYKSVSWKSKGSGIPWAGGNSGCSIAGIDHESMLLDSAVAVREVGQWLEFDIPAAIVQNWLENPFNNAGFIIKTANNVVRGEHVLFYASEHHSAKGPRLILNGTPGPIRYPVDPAKPYNPRYILPPQGTKFVQYLSEDTSRYSLWINDSLVGLNSDQGIFPYYWDIVVDGELIVPDGYMPIADMIPGLEAKIQNNDHHALREFHLKRQRYHHIFDAVREHRWYTCGDVIEILSPYQTALLYCRNDSSTGGWDGIFTKLLGGYSLLSESDIETRVSREVDLVENSLGLDPGKMAIVGPVIAQEERTRCEYFNKCLLGMEEVQQLIQQKNNGPQMIDALSRTIVNHNIFLYHDTFFGGTRWKVIMDTADMVKYTQWWIDSKYDEFSPDRIGRRWDTVREFWPETWPLPTLGSDTPETCFDAYAYGFVLPADVSGPTKGQPDCYVDFYDFAFFAENWLKCTDPQNPACYTN